MEIHPTIERLAIGWKCVCADAIGLGDTAESAYAAWLGAFRYQGPPLPIKTDDMIDSGYNYKRA